jgi:phenylalanine-4-hydroxylase
MAELHGLAASTIAPSPDWTVAQDWHLYTPEEHCVWQTLFERQIRLLPGRACDQFIEGLKRLPILGEKIPDFAALNGVLMTETGWQVVAVPGLVPDDVFFEHLAHRRFPAGQFIRKRHELDYLQEPDIFHDVFGHVPMLMNPQMADFICAYGKGGLRAKALGMLDQLARLYWYTVEFGLVRQGDGLRIFGAGIVSSYGETRFSLESLSPNRIGLDLERVMRTLYRIDDFQEAYFVLDDLAQMLEFATLDFAPHYAAIAGLPTFAPSDIAPNDVVISHGDGSYHR